MRRIKFTKDYAGFSKGDSKEFDSILASKMVNKYKVGVYDNEPDSKKPIKNKVEKEPVLKKPKRKKSKS